MHKLLRWSLKGLILAVVSALVSLCLTPLFIFLLPLVSPIGAVIAVAAVYVISFITLGYFTEVIGPMWKSFLRKRRRYLRVKE